MLMRRCPVNLHWLATKLSWVYSSFWDPCFGSPHRRPRSSCRNTGIGEAQVLALWLLKLGVLVVGGIGLVTYSIFNLSQDSYVNRCWMDPPLLFLDLVSCWILLYSFWILSFRVGSSSTLSGSFRFVLDPPLLLRLRQYIELIEHRAIAIHWLSALPQIHHFSPTPLV